MTKVAIRADASQWIGSGHIMRCATLANYLKKNNSEVHFICRKMPGDYCEWLSSHGFKVHVLPEAKSPCDASDRELRHASWLGVPIIQDQAETFSVISDISNIDWLVVDHYGLDASWEEPMRKHCNKIMVIDDLADRKHTCDLLLDQNLFKNAKERYQGNVADTCKMLLGPKYALLQNEYAALHEKTKYRQGGINRILVFFGGADEANNTEMAIEAFQEISRKDIVLDVVVGRSHERFNLLNDIANQVDNINVHTNLPSLAPLMTMADFAIGASGATSWERCCLGLPSIVIALAENQKPIASELESAGLIRYIGDVGSVSKDKIYNELKNLIDSGISRSWSKRCWNLVDGKGAKRICDSMGLHYEH